MPDDLTNKVIAWATEVGSYAAKLPSRQAREDYLAERRHQLVTGAIAEGANRKDAERLADVCADAARRILTELLVQRASGSPGTPDARRSLYFDASGPRPILGRIGFPAGEFLHPTGCATARSRCSPRLSASSTCSTR